MLHELAWAQAQPEPLQAPPEQGRKPQPAEGMARALGPAPERALVALRSKNSEGALALGLSRARALALDKQAQGPDRPGLPWTALPLAKAPRAEPLG